jgi:nudix-type nucleoside diphosphatase (YffH/AdpP family)
MKVFIEEKKRIFDKFFKIDEVKLRYEKFDGIMTPPIVRLCFERGDSVGALLLNTDTNKIILVNQFKYPCYDKGPGWITEVVAGMVGPKESPEVALRREVMEETGYRITNSQHISTFYVSPGGSSERIILFFAEITNSDRTASGGGLPSEGEDVRLVELTIPEAWAALSSGEIADAKTLIALMWLKRYLSEAR